MEQRSEAAVKTKDFFSPYPQKSFDKGELLILAGDDPGHIFYLESGQVRQYDISAAGTEVVVNVFKSTAFFPMSWAINRTPNGYFFEAATAVKVHLAPPDDAVDFIKQNPDVMFDLLSRLYRGTDGVVRRMAHLMGSGARRRLLFELILENERFGKPAGHNASTVKISEAELGARSGLSRETVSREIHELKAAGLVDIGSKGITLKKLSRLIEELGSDL